MLFSKFVPLAALIATSASAAPAPLSVRSNTAAVSILSSSDVSDLASIAELVRASYCPTASVTTWSCGAACNANPGLITILDGGNNDKIPDYYVAYSPARKAVIVAHQGTDVKSLLSVLTDAKFVPNELDQTLFPGTSELGVHSGFRDAQAKTAPLILGAVKSGMATYKTNKVLVTGHSLGGAVAILDSLYLTLNLPGQLDMEVVTFGEPRVGDKDFVAFYQTHVLNSRHVTNKGDTVPHLPPRWLGYEQTQGEIFITTDNVAESCPGLENENCAISMEPVDVSKTHSFHDGPYFGVYMGATYCTA